MSTPHLFKQYEALDLQEIQRMIDTKFQEDLHLEFKSIKNVNGLTKDDRKNFAKALSGFANSDGGLIVWGVTAKKDDASVDAASEEALIKNLNAVFSTFQSITGQAVSPIVDGVQHKPVNKNGDSGFIVTYVPASDSPPHMAKGGEDRYYKRSGDSFYRMEHYDLKDVFGRRLSAKLASAAELSPVGTHSGARGLFHQIRAVVGVRNDGRGMARFPMLSLVVRNPHTVSEHTLDGNRANPVYYSREVSQGQSKFTFRGGADDVVHAGSFFPITALKQIGVSDSATQTEDIQINCQIAAEGVPLFSERLVVSSEEIMKVVQESRSKL